MQYFALFVSFLRQNDDRLKFKHNYDINKDPKGYIIIKREITRQEKIKHKNLKTDKVKLDIEKVL